MELDELKNTWLALDKKLEKNNSFNDRIIKEILHEKGNKSMGRLIRSEMFGLIVLIGVIPLIIYGADLNPNLAGYKLFMQFMLVLVIVFILWQSLKLYCLSRINLLGSMKNNIRHINKYNIYIRKEKQGMFLLIPILGGWCSFFYVKLNVNPITWIAMTCLFIVLMIYTIWSYKRVYDKNISSIKNSLEELKDLEE